MFKKLAAALTAALITSLLPLSVYATGTEGGTQADPMQALSSEVATVYIGKVLSSTQPDKFPPDGDYEFQVQNVKAWDNSNAAYDESGTDIAASAMPRPAEKTTAHHTVSHEGSTLTNVTVGGFDGEPNTSLEDTETVKYRVTPLEITFSKAGYYMYRISETLPEGEEEPGVLYDRNSYYIVVYVCNKTDSNGNTISGVYVHDITSYRNNRETSYAPDVSDIQNVTDNNGDPAIENNFDNLAKVGLSSRTTGSDKETGLPLGPNKLEAYRFFNDFTAHDVVLKNNVTGNLGDITKAFEFTVTLTGLAKTATYTTNVAAQGTGAQTSAGAVMTGLDKGSVNPEEKTFTSDKDGNVTFKVALKDDQILVLNALPATSKYQITEAETDHVASYTAASTEKKYLITDGGEKKANTVNNKSLATNTETVDANSNVPGRTNTENNDGTITFTFKNHKDIATVTGLPYYGNLPYVMIALMIAGAAVFIVHVKKNGLRKESKKDQ